MHLLTFSCVLSLKLNKLIVCKNLGVRGMFIIQCVLSSKCFHLGEELTISKDIWDLISLLNINDGLFAFRSERT